MNIQFGASNIPYVYMLSAIPLIKNMIDVDCLKLTTITLCLYYVYEVAVHHILLKILQWFSLVNGFKKMGQ
jgi:hypothetical protein